MKYIVILLWMLPLIVKSQATVSEEVRVLTTYQFDSPNPIPVLSKNSKIYPYHTFDGYSNTPIQKEWKVITLENEYIKVFVLPEIGGKVWGAIDKVNGEEFIYRNEVIKFRNISMRGPWTSGGIEFNFGIIGHHPSTATPVDYVINTHDDGSVSCTVGNIDLPSHTQWRVTIKLPQDKSYFETNVNWYNPSPLHQSYYNWMTAAAFAQEDLVFYTPGNQYLQHSGEAKPWPVDKENRNINAYKENNFGSAKSYHVVGEYNDFFGGYFENDNYGFGHWAEYEEIPGQKLWIWALSRSGGIWEDLLTDTDGQYIEFQAGREFLQYSPGDHNNPMTQAVFPPQTQDTWTELWFPVRGINGLSDVSEHGVIHVDTKDGSLTLGLNVFGKSKGTIIIKVNDKILVEEKINVDVTQTLTRKYSIPEGADFKVEIPELDLSYNSHHEQRDIKRPFASDNLLDGESQEKDYYLGWEAYKYREYDKALAYFKACLAANPMHQSARSYLAELYYRNHRIEKSLSQLDTLLRIDTRNPHGNFVAGLCYTAIDDYVNALESFGWAARSMAFRSASYAQMAMIYLKQENFSQAKKYADKSLSFNTKSISALQVKAIAERLSNDNKAANSVLAMINEIDPINHFSRFESYLLDESSASLDLAIGSHQSELAYQTIVELAILYANLGREADALKLLEASESTNPLILLWKAHLDNSKSDHYLNQVRVASSDFVFPYRTATLGVLKEMVTIDDDWKLKYYLALNHWALEQDSEAKEIFMQLGNEPNIASFYSARKELLDGEDGYQGEADLERALDLDNSALNYHNYSLYAYKAKLYQLARSIAVKGMEDHPGDYMIEIDAAKSMLHTQEYSRALTILEQVNLLPFEGASEGKQIYEMVNIALAIEKIETGNYEGAKPNLLKAKEWPENLGVGKPYSPNEIFQDYLLAKLHLKNGDKNAFRKYAKLVEQYFDHNDNYDDAKVALVIDLIKMANGDDDKQASIMNSISADTIMRLINNKQISAEKKSVQISLIEKALSL